MPALDTRMRQLYDSSLRGAKVSPAARLLLGLVFLLFHTGRILKQAVYQLAIIPRVKLKVPTISIGNPTMGGTGKTPFTIWLAGLLGEEVGHTVVLSRGYRRQSSGWIEWVSRAGRILSTPARAGDEAFILARRLPRATVISGKHRASTGRIAQAVENPACILLDDGQQYWRLHRDIDIALLDLPLRSSQFRLFPFGELREPISRLASSDLIVLTRADQINREQRESATKFLDSVAPRVPRAWASFRLHSVVEHAGGRAVDPAHFKGKRLLAMANVANPASFVRLLQGFEPAMVVPAGFPDHHRYGPEDEVTLLTNAISHRLDCILMTEKDQVNIPPGFRLPAPAYVVKVEMEVRGDGFEIVPFLKARVVQVDARSRPHVVRHAAGGRAGG